VIWSLCYITAQSLYLCLIAPSSNLLGVDFDYILWVDADLIILDMNFDVLDLVALHPEADILISAESAGSSTLVNSGSILVKNSQFSRKFLRSWWGSSDDRIFYSDQEQFDLLYHRLGEMKTNIAILPPEAMNSDPPAMTKQKGSHKILHLMGEHNEFRAHSFSSGFREICRVLQSDSSKNTSHDIQRLKPQLNIIQENLLLWTIEIYSSELKSSLLTYRRLAATGDNDLEVTDRLANAIHHLAHAIAHRNLPGDRVKAHELRRESFELLHENLGKRRIRNNEHIKQFGKAMSNWPELVKKTAVSGLHMVESGSFDQRQQAGTKVRILLEELVQSCHVAQRPAVLQMVAYLEHHLGVLEMSEGRHSSALIHFEKAYSISLVRLIYRSIEKALPDVY